MPDHRWRRMAQRGPGAGHLVEVFPNLGYFGYYAWPELHIIDPHALADPLLARLPALRRIEWRAGHFARAMPPGYLETRRTGRNALRDPVLVELHEALTRVHRGPIFSAARFADIVRLHTGHYERAIDFDRYRYAKALHVRVSLDEGMTRAVEIDASGVFVELGERRRDRRLEIECSGDDAYRLRFLAQGDQMGAVDLPAHEQTGLSSRSVDVPSSVAAHGYDELHLMPLTLVDKTHAVLAQLRR
jgi:arabinofuranosyltransferase